MLRSECASLRDNVSRHARHSTRAVVDVNRAVSSSAQTNGSNYVDRLGELKTPQVTCCASVNPRCFQPLDADIPTSRDVDRFFLTVPHVLGVAQ